MILRVFQLIILLGCSIKVQAQTFAILNVSNVNMVEKSLRKQFKTEKIKNYEIIKTDSTLLFSVKDTGFQNVDFYYKFDKYGRCIEETKFTKCTPCVEDYKNQILAQKKMKWKKISDNLYVSKYSKKRVLQVIEDKISCPYVQVKRIKWNRTEYNMMLSNLENIK
jgi:hypothetical protein